MLSIVELLKIQLSNLHRHAAEMVENSGVGESSVCPSIVVPNTSTDTCIYITNEVSGISGFFQTMIFTSR